MFSAHLLGVILPLLVIVLVLWLWFERQPPADSTSTLLGQRCRFDYSAQNGPHTWPQHFQAAAICSAQSPINIDTGLAMLMPLRRPIVWYDYERSPRSYRLHNTGTGNLELWPTNTDASDPVPRIGSASTCAANSSDNGDASCRLSCSYVFRFVSVHWPAEHTVDNRSFQLELQATHVLDVPMAADMSVTESATAVPNSSTSATLIVSYLFGLSASGTDNPYLQQLVKRLPAIQEAGTCVEIDGFPLAWLCAPLTERGFYDYAGSWTVPPCTESVTWLLCVSAGTVSAAQLAQFRWLRSASGEAVLSNARPVQSLNGRVVHLNKLPE